ncbi:hypothetical protein N8I71_15470 [Roseibacterium sp. SDUM158016]|uniref:hypothetical protein n=1 Tax=Roseicyclus sediminis TaxID=2980997 RepID=UPI0021D0D685|nr:hypothetical protein [Roseibacterium sp. SDUM158016]MCU4654242.1 hypothetical protein [Roseibacterium sp. SDUM158016]
MTRLILSCFVAAALPFAASAGNLPIEWTTSSEKPADIALAPAKKDPLPTPVSAGALSPKTPVKPTEARNSI